MLFRSAAEASILDLENQLDVATSDYNQAAQALSQAQSNIQTKQGALDALQAQLTQTEADLGSAQEASLAADGPR